MSSQQEQKSSGAKAQTDVEAITSRTAAENESQSVQAYDFDALSENQRNVLGCIAMNIDGGHNFATLRSLEKRGLIESSRERLGGRFPVLITRYTVPLHVHIRWCEWCSAQEATHV